MFDCLFLSIETNNENEMATNRSRVPYILQTKRYFNFLNDLYTPIIYYLWKDRNSCMGCNFVNVLRFTLYVNLYMQ